MTQLGQPRHEHAGAYNLKYTLAGRLSQSDS